MSFRDPSSLANLSVHCSLVIIYSMATIHLEVNACKVCLSGAELPHLRFFLMKIHPFACDFYEGFTYLFLKPE